MNDYDGLEVELGCQNETIFQLHWDCPGIGFGILTLDRNTEEIVDDEFMSEEFCKAVIKKWKESEETK